MVPQPALAQGSQHLGVHHEGTGIMPIRSVRQLLAGRGVRHTVIEDVCANVSVQEPAPGGIPAREWVESVVFFADGRPAVAVVPALRWVNLRRLATATGAREVRFASRSETDALFPGCEPGAVPPIGGLCALPIFADSALRSVGRIAFRAGSRRAAIALALADLERVTEPVWADFGEPVIADPDDQC
ncbi:MAG: YbaK/EbsC family protein [Gemmatimonadetes bacterium]|nr:YbaK/EbsC family protein [Gemmatimonadota bacterium]